MRRKVITNILNKIRTPEVLALGEKVKEVKSKHDKISDLNLLRRKEKQQLKLELNKLKAELHAKAAELQRD